MCKFKIANVLYEYLSSLKLPTEGRLLNGVKSKRRAALSELTFDGETTKSLHLIGNNAPFA